MNNPTVFQVKFPLYFGETCCELNALVKPTENPQKFHILTVQPCNYKEIASVINDFYITKVETIWVHAQSLLSSTIVVAIGEELDKYNNTKS